jgi:GxxExxY protein
VVEVKSVERLLAVHTAQLLSYLRLSGKKLGLLLNFNVVHMRDGIKRLVNRL